MSNQGDHGDSNNNHPPYASYISDVYQKGIFAGQRPVVTTNPNLLEEEAKKAMDTKPFYYIYGGAGEMSTMDANRLSFRQWKIIPRVLSPCHPRDLRTKLFGNEYRSPILMAPVGVQGFYHPSGEKGLAKACGELGIPYTLSTAATSTIEDIATTCGSNPRWYQLYWPHDNEITASLLRRAKAAGYSTLVVTLDTPGVSWRPWDLDIANLPFIKGTGNTVGFSDPVFRAKFAEVTNGESPESNPVAASQYWLSQVFTSKHHSWDEIEQLREHWDGPIVLKGVLSVEDAQLAVQHGIDGIVVSNHGGRQVDGSVASLEMLPDIVDAVGHSTTVMFDSGVRTGADILKALALGAQAVFVGRPALYGLGISGKDGAQAVLAGLLADLDQTMGISGFRAVADLKRSVLRKVLYGGDVKSCY